MASMRVVTGVLLVALFGVAGCGSGVAGSGHVRTETRNVRGFDAVELSRIGSLAIRQSDVDSLQVQADDNILPLVTSDVAGETLRLGIQPGTTIDPTTLRYLVTVQRLRGVSVSGVGDVAATGVDSPLVSVDLSGAGHLTLSGRVASQTVRLSGTGSYDGSNLASLDAHVAVSGTGSALVDASRTLDAEISGAGSVEYLGNPRVTQSVSGTGIVRRRA
jgi:hypothetical protein